MPKSLPKSPSVRFLRLEAKDLLEAFHSRDVDGCKAFRLVSRYSQLTNDRFFKSSVRLADAQYALALSYGFKDWKALKSHAESATSEGVRRKRSAISFADGVAYGRLTAEDPGRAVRALKACQKVFAEITGQHHGRILDWPADKVLSQFASAADAVQSAIEIQQEIRTMNPRSSGDRGMEFRIGINYASLVEQGERVSGLGIDVAAKIGAYAEPGGICITGAAREEIEALLSLSYEDLDEHTLGNIPEPVKVYRIVT